jgi:hypothetical protein
MASDKQQRARGIQEAIREILLRDWDPIGINDVPEANDEYDSYVGGVYRLLASQCSADQLIDHLFVIETQTMGLSVPERERLRPVANKLLGLNVSL